MIPVFVERPLAAAGTYCFFPPLEAVRALSLCVKSMPVVMAAGFAYPQVAASRLVSAFWAVDFHESLFLLSKLIQEYSYYYIPNVFLKQYFRSQPASEV
jgi:hypothetical protein